MIVTSRFVESILCALGATPEYRDLVVGDLAEELALRTAQDGMAVARRWYVREAFRAVPHLLGDGLRNAGYRGIGHLLGLVLTTWALVTITVGPALIILLGIVTPIWPEFLPLAQDASRWPAFAIMAASATALVGGAIAAALHRPAPLQAALAFGTACAVTEFVLESVGLAGHGAFWFPFVVPPVMFIAAVAGGLFYLRKDTRSETSVDAAL